MSRRVLELALLLEEREAPSFWQIAFDGATRRAHPGETSRRGWATANVPCTSHSIGHTCTRPLEWASLGLAIPRSTRATRRQPNTPEWEGRSDPFGAKVTGSIEP